VEIADLAKDQLLLEGFFAAVKIWFQLENDGVGKNDKVDFFYIFYAP
jgi:hypothetical protein